jgi:NAD-dependent SIR2 family protein deacetylase
MTTAHATSVSGLPALLRVLRGRRVVVLAGAGCSTESGIPDYRGPDGALRGRAPMQYREFVDRPERRVRYWSRSMIGWTRVALARPNDGHRALARLEEAGVVRGIITQNVDGLHHAAGSRRVIELHGALARVMCMTCGARSSRAEYQSRLAASNPDWAARIASGSGDGSAPAAPDGDAHVDAGALLDFVVPACECGGIIKPDVVFFGENVPRQRVDEAWTLFDEAEALLVVGSSLAVFSGRRFTMKAQERGVPVAIAHMGPTRADEYAACKVEAPLSVVLPRLAEELGRA